MTGGLQRQQAVSSILLVIDGIFDMTDPHIQVLIISNSVAIAQLDFVSIPSQPKGYKSIVWNTKVIPAGFLARIIRSQSSSGLTLVI